MKIEDIKIGDEVTLYSVFILGEENFKTSIIGACKGYVKDNGRKIGDCIFVSINDTLDCIGLNNIKEINGVKVDFSNNEKYANSKKDETLLVTIH